MTEVMYVVTRARACVCGREGYTESEGLEWRGEMAKMSKSSHLNSLRLFDAHCHLQDSRVRELAPQLIRSANESGVLRFAVNGVDESDWHVVKKMSEEQPSVIPCFGIHPWYVMERSSDWLQTLRDFISDTPNASVGEIGLDKGSRGKQIDFETQVQVFRQQLELAKEFKKPASVHCVRAYADLQQIMESTGPFPAGILLHSYLGSAEMVPGFAKLGAYFSFSGFLMSLKPQKAKKMLKSVPGERLLLETDAPDGVPHAKFGPLQWVPGDINAPSEAQNQNSEPAATPKGALNHPSNIRTVLSYVASLLDMHEDRVAEMSYENADRLFSCSGL